MFISQKNGLTNLEIPDRCKLGPVILEPYLLVFLGISNSSYIIFNVTVSCCVVGSICIYVGNKGKRWKIFPAQESSGCISRFSFSPDHCVLFTTFWLSCNSFCTFIYSPKKFHGSFFDHPNHRGVLVGHSGLTRSVSSQKCCLSL